MGGMARLDRKRIARFNQCWEDLYKVVPQAKAEAVKAMGEAARKELDAQILAADLAADAKGTVQSWQTVKLGSRGGYAAVRAKAYKWSDKRGKPKFWKDVRVSTRMVTKWLDQGHGARKPAPGSARQWARVGRSGINLATGTRYVKARRFYSWTKRKALDLALKAADEVLSKIADEVDY